MIYYVQCDTYKYVFSKWAAKKNFNTLVNNHYTVNHSKMCVNSCTGASTQTIEFKAHFKNKKMHKTNHQMLHGYLIKVCYRSIHTSDYSIIVFMQNICNG